MKQPEIHTFGLAEVLSEKDLSKILYWILGILFVLFLLGGSAYFFTHTSVMLLVTQNSLVMSVVTLFSLFLIHHKKYSQAVFTMNLGCGLVLGYGAWNGLGVSGLAYSLYGLLVLGATIYWGQRAGLIVTVLVGLWGLFLVYAKEVGWLLYTDQPVADWFVFGTLILFFALVALLVGYILKYLEKQVFETRDINDQLELRVMERTARLVEQENVLRILSENVQDVIWMTDLQMNILYITPSASRLRGMSMDELIKEPVEKAMTPASYRLAMQIFHEEIEKENNGATPDRSRIFQLDYYAKDGSIIPTEVRASLLRDVGGKVVGITGVTRDLRDRQWMEAILRESEERNRKIADVISDYTFSIKLDENRQVILEWVAGAFEEITGYEFSEFLDMGGWGNLLHPDSLAQDALDRELLESNRPVEGSQLCIRRKDGELRWVRNFAYPVWDATANHLAGFYGGVQDMTVEKQATERLQALNADLEKRVAERTSSLEKALGELESFSYSISHDLRAPLRAVNGYAGILLAEYRKEFPPDAVQKLMAIKENGQRMGQLVDGLLQFLRSGNIEIQRERVNTAEIVQGVLMRLRPDYANRAIEFVVGDLPPCFANLRLLDKIYEGLIGNAIKFTRNRPAARIEVGSFLRDEHVVYFVRDNGVGFDMKYYEKLFGVFQRLHHANEFEGIGASLAIMQRIINRHGGHIWAEGELDRGATFFFTLKKE